MSTRQTSEIVVILLAAAVVVGRIAASLRIPYAVALLLASLALSFSAASAFAPSVLVIFLPALVFEASWQLDIGLMRHYWKPIAFLAVPGVAITAFAFGARQAIRFFPNVRVAAEQVRRQVLESPIVGHPCRGPGEVYERADRITVTG